MQELFPKFLPVRWVIPFHCILYGSSPRPPTPPAPQAAAPAPAPIRPAGQAALDAVVYNPEAARTGQRASRRNSLFGSLIMPAQDDTSKRPSLGAGY